MTTPKDKAELSPFERFQWLARRLIAVPKAEIDKEKAELTERPRRSHKKRLTQAD